MKAVRFSGKRQLEYFGTDEPQIKNAGDVKIKVKFSGISAADLLFYDKKQERYAWDKLLNDDIIGHDISGVIVDMGREAEKQGFKIGDRVCGFPWISCGECYYCRSGKESHCINMKLAPGTLAEYVVWPCRQLLVLPKEITMEQGCALNVVSQAVYGVERADIEFGDSVMVMGGGLEGLLICRLAELRGAGRVTFVDANSELRKLAETMGADITLNPDGGEMTYDVFTSLDNPGYDHIFAAAHNDTMIEKNVNFLARKGNLLLSGFYGFKNSVSIPLDTLYLKENSIIAYYVSPIQLMRVKMLMPKLKLENIPVHVYEFKDAQTAYDIADKKVQPLILIDVESSKNQ
jgi:Threonine dehydrogenase and related Zn-dependent dehydrogenases